MSRDWAEASLTETVDAMRRGEATAREVVECCLDRRRRRDSVLHCVVELDEDEARVAADRADALRSRGASLGRLHGAPLAHKDMFLRKGRVSACGSQIFADRVASETASALKQLDAAGALEIGRLVMVEFALGPHGHNANHPPCRNAWNPDYIPCGSSSGSGVAVAAGVALGSLGSDTGGSIRCPAAANGLVGLLPTKGVVSRCGAMPMSFSFDTVGPLTRTPRDSARLLDALMGVDEGVGCEAALDIPGPLPRIGVARGYFDEDLDPELAGMVEEAAALYRALGFKVVDVELPAETLRDAAELHPLIMKAEGAANHMSMMGDRREDYTTEVGDRLEAGLFIPATAYIQAQKLRKGIIRDVCKAVFTQVDLLLTPTFRQPLPTIEETTNLRGHDYVAMVQRLTANTKVVNFLALPALVAPTGLLRSGLPSSMQLIGDRFSERSLLVAAHLHQQAVGWRGAPHCY